MRMVRWILSSTFQWNEDKQNGGRGRRRQKKTEVISLPAYSFVVRRHIKFVKKKSNKLQHFTGLLVLTLECLTIYMSLLLLKYACIDLNNVNIGWITSKQKWQQIKLHREAASLDKSFVTSFSISLSHLYHIIRPWWLDNSLNVFYPVSLSQK